MPIHGRKLGGGCIMKGKNSREMVESSGVEE